VRLSCGKDTERSRYYGRTEKGCRTRVTDKSMDRCGLSSNGSECWDRCTLGVGRIHARRDCVITNDGLCVTVVVLLTSLISDALEIVLDLGMLVVPANEERRDMREGVSDCVEDRFEDIVGNCQTVDMGYLFRDDPGERSV